jgi:hypothetical protein
MPTAVNSPLAVQIARERATLARPAASRRRY